MNTTPLELNKIYDLAFNRLKIMDVMILMLSLLQLLSLMLKEMEVYHMVCFSIPGYIASLKSKKVNGAHDHQIRFLHKMLYGLMVIMVLLL